MPPHADNARQPAGRIIRGLFLAALLAVPTAAVVAQTTDWDAGTGDWFNAANWTDGVPDAMTSTNIMNEGTAQITDPGAVAGGLDVGFDVDGTLEITGGGTLTSEFGRLGTSSDGTVLVSGAGSNWTSNGNLSIGPTGTGDLTISAGAVMENQIGSVGGLGSGVGVVTVTGAGSEWFNNDRLQIANFGQGELTIADGAVAGTLDEAIVGNNADAFGEVTVTGTGSEFLVDNELIVGVEGEGVVTIGAGARLETGGLLVIGQPGSQGGTVVADGEIAGSGIRVQDTGFLGGEGSVSAVEVSGNGEIQAGGELVGTLTTAGLTLGTNTVTELDLGPPGTVGGGVNDLLVIEGDLTLDGQLAIDNAGGLAEGTYTVMTYTGSLTNFSAVVGETPNGFDAEIDTTTPGEVNLVVVGVDPELTFNPRDIFFPDTEPGDSASNMFALENTGQADLVVSAISDTGPHYSIEPGNCGALPVTLPPGESCDMQATFTPRFGGDLTRIVEFESNAPDSPDVAFLIGNGIVQAIPALGPWGVLLLIAGTCVTGLAVMARR